MLKRPFRLPRLFRFLRGSRTHAQCSWLDRLCSHDPSLSLQVLPQVVAILPLILLHLHLFLWPSQYASPRLTSKPRPHAATKALRAAAVREMWLFSFQVSTTRTRKGPLLIMASSRAHNGALARRLLLTSAANPATRNLCYVSYPHVQKSISRRLGTRYRKLPKNSKGLSI